MNQVWCARDETYLQLKTQALKTLFKENSIVIFSSSIQKSSIIFEKSIVNSWRSVIVQTVTILRQQVFFISIQSLNVSFSECHKMHFSQILLYDVILIARVYTALTAINMIDFIHDAESKNSSKSDNSFANETKDSKAQVKSKIDEKLHRWQICTHLFVKTRLKKITEQVFKDRNLRLSRKRLQRVFKDEEWSHLNFRQNVSSHRKWCCLQLWVTLSKSSRSRAARHIHKEFKYQWFIRWFHW